MNHLELYVSHDDLGKIHLKHLLNVFNRMNTLVEMVAGLLHDVAF